VILQLGLLFVVHILLLCGWLTGWTIPAVVIAAADWVAGTLVYLAWIKDRFNVQRCIPWEPARKLPPRDQSKLAA
jgi:hypothetical protein